MGGSVSVDSEPGKGSEFCVTLPFGAGVAEGAEAEQDVPHRRLLVVDDNATSRAYLTKTIRTWGWEAESAPDGEEALRLAERSGEGDKPFDAALVDWQMPGMDGVATIAALRKKLPRTAMFLMVNAYGRSRLVDGAAALASDTVLIKPVTGSDLFDALQDALPAAADVQLGANMREPEIAQENRRLDGTTLLVVEDNAMNQIVARSLLEQAGAAVDIAGDGQAAVDLLARRERSYDLILMDVQMPVMDGYAATRIIRSELHLTLPVIAMTAGVTESERSLCLDAGMDDFVSKPINMESLFATLSRHLHPAS